MSASKPDSLRMRDLNPTGVRLAPDLKKRLMEAAGASNRSLSAEIVARLEASFQANDDWVNALENIDDALARIERLERDLYDLSHQVGFRRG